MGYGVVLEQQKVVVVYYYNVATSIHPSSPVQCIVTDMIERRQRGPVAMLFLCVGSGNFEHSLCDSL